MLRETTVFGPIFSRRLGRSLGVNLLPERGKVCNFDCVYCECGWNKDGLEDRKLPCAADVELALRTKLEECAAAGTPIDSITFSGDGEPTLNPSFAQIIDLTLALRNRYYPAAKVSVLTNATRAGEESVFQALCKVDNAILKLDAPTDEQVALVNRPAGNYHVSEVIRSMKRFNGAFVLQTMFLRGPGWATEDWVGPWMEVVRKVTPREVMVYTIDRETPLAGLKKYTVEEMRALVQPLIDEGYIVQIKG